MTMLDIPLPDNCHIQGRHATLIAHVLTVLVEQKVVSDQCKDFILSLVAPLSK